MTIMDFRVKGRQMKRLYEFTLAIVLLILSLVFGSTPGTAHAASFISADEVRQLQSSNASFLLIDVRMSQSFNLKHIEGAINIPAFSIGKKRLPAGQIIIYDGGIGTIEARDAMGNLTAAGNTSVFILEGGLAGWEALGLPMTVQTGILSTRLSETVSVTELSRAMSDGLNLIIADIRMPEVFREGTVPGARNISPDDVLDVSRGWRKDSIIILIDSGDDEALKQAEKLRRAGFKLIRFLYGGFPEWKRQNAK